jgi:16S rRNA (cytidine1402-2'-O)-methyltransferase
MAGTLFVVSTPIGNLGDLSARAGEVLRSVAVIAAEDTRETRKLADHAGSAARLVSLHAHSDPSRITHVIELLEAGQDVALTTDAGTPGVSDPGPAVVARARLAGITVVPIPGPSAVHAALAASGLPADRYVFLGFPPRKGTGRVEWLARIRDSSFTVVCFEAPTRTVELVAELARVCGDDRRAVVARELTKRFEEVRAGSLGELAAALEAEPPRGEVTVVVAGAEPTEAAPDAALGRSLARALARAEVEPTRAAKVIGEVAGLSRADSYRLTMEDR